MEAVLKNKYVRILTIVLLLQATLFYTVSHGDSKPLAQPLREFPQSLGGWQMITEGVVGEDTMAVLKADDAISRVYAKTPTTNLNQLTPEQRVVAVASSEELFVAYFSTQQQGQSPHSPKNCLPGAGWQPLETGEITIPVPGMAAPITINKYVISKGESESLVLYWFQSHGRVVANEFAAKFFLVADSLRYHRSDTAIVRVISPVVHGDVAVALDGATKFAQAVFPAVYRYLPM